jgi:hypothetical protein
MGQTVMAFGLEVVGGPVSTPAGRFGVGLEPGGDAIVAGRNLAQRLPASGIGQAIAANPGFIGARQPIRAVVDQVSSDSVPL